MGVGLSLQGHASSSSHTKGKAPSSVRKVGDASKKVGDAEEVAPTVPPNSGTPVVPGVVPVGGANAPPLNTPSGSGLPPTRTGYGVRLTGGVWSNVAPPGGGVMLPEVRDRLNTLQRDVVVNASAACGVRSTDRARVAGVAGSTVVFSDSMDQLLRKMGVNGPHTGTGFVDQYKGTCASNPNRGFEYVHIKAAQLQEGTGSNYIDLIVMECATYQVRFNVTGFGVNGLYDIIVSFLEVHKPTIVVLDRQIFLKFAIIAEVVMIWPLPYFVREGVVRTRSVEAGTLESEAWLII